MILEAIIAHGNRPPLSRKVVGGCTYGPGKIRCVDGFTMSVIAGDGTYCSPRPSSFGLPHIGEVSGEYPGPFTHVEVGFPSVRPEPWDEWAKYVEDSDEPTSTVYGYVPADLVRALVAAHGGEA